MRGSVFDLAHAMSQPDDDCNVLLVSSRTLYFVQLFGSGEVDFVSRYASSFLAGNRYILAQTPGELDSINDLANLYELEVQPVTAALIEALNGIQQAITNTGANACACGVVGETVPVGETVEGGTPPPGFGEPDPIITDRKCKAANAIHATILDIITDLENSPVEGFITLGFGVVAGLVSAIIAATFIPVVGLLVVGVAGTIVTFTLALLAAGIDLTELRIVLMAAGTDLVCALYDAADSTTARDDYKQIFTDGGVSAINVALIGALLTDDVLALLFFSTPTSEAFLDTYAAPIPCTGCSSAWTVEVQYGVLTSSNIFNVGDSVTIDAEFENIPGITGNYWGVRFELHQGGVIADGVVFDCVLSSWTDYTASGGDDSVYWNAAFGIIEEIVHLDPTRYSMAAASARLLSGTDYVVTLTRIS